MEKNSEAWADASPLPVAPSSKALGPRGPKKSKGGGRAPWPWPLSALADSEPDGFPRADAALAW
eukprot:339127-Pyramimonas_sp.AAC.1